MLVVSEDGIIVLFVSVFNKEPNKATWLWCPRRGRCTRPCFL